MVMPSIHTIDDKIWRIGDGALPRARHDARRSGQRVVCEIEDGPFDAGDKAARGRGAVGGDVTLNLPEVPEGAGTEGDLHFR